jgi:hypothetical protein
MICLRKNIDTLLKNLWIINPEFIVIIASIRPFFAITSLASLLFFSCGEESVGPASSGSAFNGTTALKGAYRVESWLVSEGDCNAPGVPKEFLGDSLAVVTVDAFGGTNYLRTKSCGTLAACDSVANGSRVFYGWGQDFTAGSDATGFSGKKVLAGENFGEGTCGGSLEDISLVVGAANTLTIQLQSVDAGAFAIASNGFCKTDDAASAAAGKACSQKDVIVLKPLE